MSHFPNRAISASAGMGKTFRLTHRYLGLMASGVSPDHICALTFSRKAAGEIFDRIVENLCAAATDGFKRARTAATIMQEGLVAPPDDPNAYMDLLRKLLDAEHRLRIGTLDSFILGVVRAFPMELGIPPDTQPMDGDGGEALAMRQAILTDLFDPTRRSGTEGNIESSAFLKDFRQACFGQETKTLVTVLDTFVSEHYAFYRQHNKDAIQWGDIARIWQPAERWWQESGRQCAETPADLPVSFTGVFGVGMRPETLAVACAEIANTGMVHTPDKPWPKLNETILSKLLFLAAHNQKPIIKYYKTDYSIPANLWPPLRRALGNLIKVELARAQERTRGLRAVLDRYDRLYADALNKNGHYTFEDLSRLLGADGLSPSRTPAAPNRLYIDYRLDGKLDHWLLDEFQDTSDTQWAALENLIDEVVQGEDRSFFYVGDIKQSVYGWRGGNHRLFGQVLKLYGQPGPRRIVSESISECHRSLPAIIETVNAVFDGLSGWKPAEGDDKGPREGALNAFCEAWKKHKSARLGEGEGFAALLEYVPKKKGGDTNGGGDGDDDDDEDPAEFEAVAKVVEQVRPALHNRTVAVLVRSNREGRTCADVLRRQLPDVPVIHEGKGGIVDNPVVTLLLGLVHYAAHPGDTAALRHLQMSPLATRPEILDFDALPLALLTDIQERGFADALRVWGERLGKLDAFGKQRLHELLAAAEQFDGTGGRDPDAFVDHIEAYQVKTSAAEGTVRVMTIHQAKGLGFDLVIVPFSTNARSFEKPGDPGLLAGDNWALDTPGHQALTAAAGAPLRALEAARTEANFAQLCVLYVALTRAQQALYMIIPAKAKTSKTVREADLLRERLTPDANSGETESLGPTQLYMCGDREWFKRPGKREINTAPPCRASVHVEFAAEILRREPSKEDVEGRSFPAGWLFGSESGDVRAFGSAIHRLFQEIEWIEDTDIERVVAAWRGGASEPEAFLADVERQFRFCLARDEVRKLLSRPADAARSEVWREAPFNLVLNTAGQPHIMSGRFDRLTVERDATGQPVRATICDFKSNRVETDADLQRAAQDYAGQMSDYARAAGRLLDLPVEQIVTLLLFTRTGRTLRC